MAYPKKPSPLVRVGQVLLALTCSAGLLAGGFLLLCALGVLSPTDISRQVTAWLDPQPDSSPVSATQEITVEDPIQKTDGPLQAVLLPLDQLDQAQTLAAGSDGVILPMKNPDGSLGYVSAISLAADAGASAADPDRNQDLQALNDTPGLYTIAQVSCLQDGALVQTDPDLGLERVSGSAWLDQDGQGWLDPADPQVQSYLAGVCQEIARLGFDEILLTNFAYPTQGQTDALRPTANKTDTLTTLCRQLQGALADYDVTLSVAGQADSAQPNAPSGQTTAFLAAFGRVWAPAEDQAALAAFHPSLLPDC